MLKQELHDVIFLCSLPCNGGWRNCKEFLFKVLHTAMISASCKDWISLTDWEQTMLNSACTWKQGMQCKFQKWMMNEIFAIKTESMTSYFLYHCESKKEPPCKFQRWNVTRGNRPATCFALALWQKMQGKLYYATLGYIYRGWYDD